MVAIDDIKQLREETSMSYMDVKRALEEGGGDVEKTRQLLASRGQEIAKKKQERETEEGIIETYLHSTKKSGVLLDLGCETDFVAKSPDFQNLAHELVLQIAAMKADSSEELLSQEYIKDPSKKVGDVVQEYIAKLGENIVINRFERYQI